MERKYDIMVAGHLCLDIIPRFPNTGAKVIGDIMRPGKLVNMLDAKISTGGPVSNTGINLKTLGNKVCFCARVGDDIMGKITADILSDTGNAEGIHRVEGIDSSYTVVIAPPGIDRVFLHNPATNNTFGPEDLDPDFIAQCRHFHFGYPPLMERMYSNDGDELMQVFKIAKEAGATTSCDMTLPDPDSPSGKVNWRKILEKTIPYVDIYLPSIEETFYMLEKENFLKLKEANPNKELLDFITPADYTRLTDTVFSLGAKMCSLKSGHRGFYIRTSDKSRIAKMGAAQPGDPENWSNRELWMPAHEVDSFGSATGSGDSSIAGFLSGFLRGLSIEDSLRYATCCGLQNVRVLDAVSGIKPWDETTAMIESKIPRMDPKLDSSVWSYEDQEEIWVGPNDKSKK